jgi:hypothetical protein
MERSDGEAMSAENDNEGRLPPRPTVASLRIVKRQLSTTRAMPKPLKGMRGTARMTFDVGIMKVKKAPGESDGAFYGEHSWFLWFRNGAKFHYGSASGWRKIWSPLTSLDSPGFWE